MKFDFINTSSEKLSGRLELPTGTPKAFALFAHCFTCSKNSKAATSISRALTRSGFAVLRFDFTGLGNSEGDFSNSNFSSNIEDIMAAIKALSERFEPPKLLIGHSLGGAAVLRASLEAPSIEAVCTIGAPAEAQHVLHFVNDKMKDLEATGETAVEIGGQQFNIKKQFVDDIQKASSVESLRQIKKPLLLLHSPIDNIVSVENAAKIFQSAMHPKSYISLDNADHLLSKKEDAEYAARLIAEWADRYISSGSEELQVLKGSVGVFSDRTKAFRHICRSKEHIWFADEPKSLGGDDTGPTPVDLLLSSLGTCTAITMKMYAKRKEWDLKEAHVHLSIDYKYKSEEQTLITKDIELHGDLNEEQVQRLLEIAEKCPVNRILKEGALVQKSQ